MERDPATARHDRTLGTLLLGAGAGAFLWMLLYRLANGVSIPRPPMTPALWLVGAGLLVGFGLRKLWNTEHPRSIWSPTQPGRRFHSIVLYSREHCCLCEEAAELLAEYRDWLPSIVEVDIDSDPDLQAQFDELVPVVMIDGQIRFKGRVDEILLRRLIEGSLPVQNLRERM